MYKKAFDDLSNHVFLKLYNKLLRSMMEYENISYMRPTLFILLNGHVQVARSRTATRNCKGSDFHHEHLPIPVFIKSI